MSATTKPSTTTKHSTARLLSPVQIGDFKLPNRVVMAPLTRSRAGEDRIANELMAEYYTQRASAGLIISEATSISPAGLGWVQSPGIYTDKMVDGWKIVTDAVHAAGGRMVMQMWHCGRASHSDFHGGQKPPAPSAIKLDDGEQIHTPEGKKDREVPRAMTTDEVQQTVDDYGKAAANAKRAGFDGVEIHAANGYLIDEFLQSKTNHRGDQYGGNVANRTRFLLEIVDRVTQEFDAQRVGVRISPNGVFNDMGSPDFREQFTFVAKSLDPKNLAYLHVMDGLAFGFHEIGEPMSLSELRRSYRGCVIGNCGYDYDQASERVAAGDADAIAFGRPYISNPDLVERFATGGPLKDPYPVQYWYSHGAEGYTVAIDS